jgi:hypothetical protein
MKEKQPGREYFYRLYQEDYSGDYSYSPIVSAKLAGGSGPVFTVYPNPGNEKLIVRQEGFPVSTTRLQIVDAYGRVWRDVQIDQQLEVETTGWPAGCYYLYLISGEGVVLKKWIKK